MRKSIGLTLLTGLACIFPVQAQDSPSNARLIEFDQDRAACLPKKTAAFDATSLRRAGSISGQYRADAMSLDQNWIRLKHRDDHILVASANLRFGSC